MGSNCRYVKSVVYIYFDFFAYKNNNTKVAVMPIINTFFRFFIHKNCNVGAKVTSVLDQL